jgi:hypothetical protein
MSVPLQDPSEPTDAQPQPEPDPRSLPFYICNRGERRFLRIKQKLTDEQLYQLHVHMDLIREQHAAEVQRAVVDTAVARRDGTS